MIQLGCKFALKLNGKDMTLKELFSKVKFENIAPWLIKFDPQSETCLWLFKQAFDRMRQIPVGEADGVTIDVKGWRVWSPTRESWNVELAREIKAAKSAPRNKVAAAILWELTFYGFDIGDKPSFAAEDFQSRFEYGRDYDESELDENPYRREWTELWQQEHDLECRHSKDIGTKFFSCEDVDDLFAPLPPETEALLKPISERKEEVERKMRRYDLATELIQQHKGGIKNPEKFRQFIMDAPPFDMDRIKAVCQLEKTEEYLSDIIYQWFPTMKGDSSLVLINCPEGIDGNDILETVWAAFGSFRKLPKPKFILSQSLETKEVVLTILTFDSNE